MKVGLSSIRPAAAVLAASAVLCACGAFPRVTDRFDPGYDTLEGAEITEETLDDLEQDLRGMVAREIAETKGYNDNRDELIREKPYYYKEYFDYPDGRDTFEIRFQEQESRTSPYVADVTLNKIRYATKLYRNREEAYLDNNFIRATGEETRSYELRNGRWVRTGSLFVAGTTEEFVDGQWVATTYTPPRPDLADMEGDGWFSRTLDRLQFWR